MKATKKGNNALTSQSSEKQHAVDASKNITQLEGYKVRCIASNEHVQRTQNQPVEPEEWNHLDYQPGVGSRLHRQRHIVKRKL